MGTISVKGSASRDFEADIFNINIKITANESESGQAVSTGKKRTEQFLEIMKEQLLIEPSEFRAEEYSVVRGYGVSEGYNFSKSLSIKINADLAAVERISGILCEMSDIEYTMNYELSDESAKENEVLRLAVEDSRKKAETIAEMLGQRIIGTENVSCEYPDCTAAMPRCAVYGIDTQSTNGFADKLKNPVRNISKSVNIVWKTENKK